MRVFSNKTTIFRLYRDSMVGLFIFMREDGGRITEKQDFRTLNEAEAVFTGKVSFYRQVMGC
ncbi:hypothetical protein [Endozoicomonas sp. SESOKO1]|uniref:hypothetical protein n=1 Tax=Endozoicomonas sp. SESOKO1 TaxID=2828742 RepID=UPI002148373F|nr:hypothetical protein [Endozoicomonas sp. SESOKO1]